MDISQAIATLKKKPGFNENVGMVLAHNGIARATSRDGAPVSRLFVTPDLEKIEAVRRECLKEPGVFDILVEAKGGEFTPGDDLLFIVVAGDIRENVLAALSKTLNRIKTEALTKKEIPA